MFYSDKELLEEIALDNPIAFKALHDLYARDMFLYAFNILNHKESCEDIVQNIFVDFWLKRKDMKITNVKSYLFVAVKYQVFNYFRDKKITKEDITRLNILEMSPNASRKMEYLELEETILASVMKLSKRCREIFELSRFQHKSHKEISEELEISIQAVKNQISKALVFLRKELQN
ncbi:RNA polymerase sigma-70 factor [Flavivirga amylovorans]|uniref:RNA polymerase sigma-70 factor n=1 Tax=Flavivirga amylovorans TaxID=870486 RepID=A0ABT8WWC5_9FLAO|nr:RNA polymerase sigma-70 factor [Flavivirga amylovorans]MDO5985778.1 RNA polymerase sigma-70 factor [Flavivirga amylovorans]